MKLFVKKSINLKRIIIDTNLWISFLISKKNHEIEKLLEEKAILLLYSIDLISELIRVTSRPKFKKYFTDDVFFQLVEVFEAYGEEINIISNLQLCRDENDNFLLNFSVDGNADFLVTGDKDLLVLKQIEKTKIVSYTDFLNI